MKLMVNIGDRSYPIYIGSGYLSDKSLVAGIVAGRKTCIVTNETIAALYLGKVKSLFDAEAVIVLPDGEQFKNLQGIEQIITGLLKSKLNRKSLLVALGGGVIGDMTGFAAACYQRGIDFIQVPTTLLAQVDSSVGGKTGVNHLLGKNMIGAFHQPRLVVIDTDTLVTLPDRELAAGLAEVIKYGLIADKHFFDWLEEHVDELNNREEKALAYAISRSCEIKAEVVSVDEKEEGLRAILNLGHTFGHAIETVQGYGKWLHGEAVAVGMVMAVDMSCRLGWLSGEVLDRTLRLLGRARLPVSAPAGMRVADFIEVMAVDKKNVQGNIRLVLLKSLGEACVTDAFDPELMKVVIQSNISKL